MDGSSSCRRAAALSWAAAMLAAIGCNDPSPATYPASGTVMFEDGAPAPFGVVEMRSSSGGFIARGKVDRSGNFVLGTFAATDGAVAGRHRVIIVQHLAPDQAARANQHRSHRDHQTALVPMRFSSYESSPLSAEIKPIAGNTLLLKVPRLTASPDRAAR